MTGYLSTHVLDTARGRPAEGLKVQLFRLIDGTSHHVRTLHTNSDGRTDELVLPEAEFEPGAYQLDFHARPYLETFSPAPDGPRFLDVVPIRFGMSEPIHYHVPLLLSPFAYSTYLGS